MRDDDEGADGDGAVDPALAAEVLRIHQRWIVEIIERYDLCPFARPARQAGAVVRRVVASTAAAGRQLASLARDDEVEVVMLLFPLLRLDAAGFERLCLPLRSGPDFVGAVFHPETPYGLETPARAIGFFRRAPDPMLQLVRSRAMRAVRGGDDKMLFDYSADAWQELQRREARENVADKIAHHNFRRLSEQRQEIEAVYAAIMADRSRSYGAG